MKKASAKRMNDDLRPEYQLSQLRGGVRGMYHRQAAAGTNLVLIEPELANVFSNTESLNRACWLLVDAAEAAAAPSSRRRRAPNKRFARGTRVRLATALTGVDETNRPLDNDLLQFPGGMRSAEPRR